MTVLIHSRKSKRAICRGSKKERRERLFEDYARVPLTNFAERQLGFSLTGTTCYWGLSSPSGIDAQNKRCPPLTPRSPSKWQHCTKVDWQGKKKYRHQTVRPPTLECCQELVSTTEARTCTASHSHSFASSSFISSLVQLFSTYIEHTTSSFGPISNELSRPSRSSR